MRIQGFAARRPKQSAPYPVGPNDNSDTSESSKMLVDPLNVDSERTPSDYGQSPREQEEKQKRLAKLIDERFQASYDQRRLHDVEYQESLAFYRGQQWVAFNATTGVLNDLRDNSNPERVYSVNNKLRPAAFHVIARGLATQADAQFRPKTRREVDVLGTRQMRSIWGHVQQANDWDALVAREIAHCSVVGPCYCKTYYDTSVEVEVPEFDPNSPDPNNPEIIAVHDAQLGDIKLEFVSTFELYLDPKARHWDDMEWVIHAKRRSLEYIKTRWPEEGAKVAPEQSGPGQTIANQLDAIVGEQTGAGTGTGRHTAILKEMWELPTAAYPKGRYVVSAGGRILNPDPADQVYPYPKMAKQRLFPFEVMAYRDGLETVWADNAMFAVVGPQRNYNRANSKIQERSKAGDGKLLVARGAELDHKAFRSEKRDEVVYYTHQDPRNPSVVFPEPKYVPHAEVDPSVTEGLRVSDADIKEIVSVNDPTLGIQPAGGLSGKALDTLQDGDQTEGTLFKANFARFVRKVAHKVGILAQQFYLKDEARLIFVQDTAPQKGQFQTAQANMQANQQANQQQTQQMQAQGAPPGPGQGQDADDPLDSPRMEAMVFSHVSEGRWTVDANAAAAMSPAARRQMLMQLFQSGALAPQQIPVTIVFLKELGLTGDDPLADDLLCALEYVQQQQLASQPAPPDPMQVAMVQAHAKAMVEQALLEPRTQARIAEIQAQTEAEITKMKAERAAPPSISLTGKLDPAGVLAAEEQAGLHVNDTAPHLAGLVANAPDLAQVHGLTAPTPPQPDPRDVATHQAALGMATAEHGAGLQSQQAVQQAQLAQQGAEHGAGLEMQKAQATQAMTPPAPAPPDPNEEMQRQMKLRTHEADQKIREIKAQPPPKSSGKP